MQAEKKGARSGITAWWLSHRLGQPHPRLDHQVSTGYPASDPAYRWYILGGSRWWLKHLGPYHSHRRLKCSSWILLSLDPFTVSFWASEQQMEELFFKHIKINILKQHITYIKKRCTGSRELSEQITHPTENPANHSCPLLTGQWVAMSSKSSGRSLEVKPLLIHRPGASSWLPKLRKSLGQKTSGPHSADWQTVPEWQNCSAWATWQALHNQKHILKPDSELAGGRGGSPQSSHIKAQLIQASQMPWILCGLQKERTFSDV